MVVSLCIDHTKNKTAVSYDDEEGADSSSNAQDTSKEDVEGPDQLHLSLVSTPDFGFPTMWRSTKRLGVKGRRFFKVRAHVRLWDAS